VKRRGTFHNATLDLDRIELMCFVVLNDAAMTSEWSHRQPSATSKSECVRIPRSGRRE